MGELVGLEERGVVAGEGGVELVDGEEGGVDVPPHLLSRGEFLPGLFFGGGEFELEGGVWLHRTVLSHLPRRPSL